MVEESVQRRLWEEEVAWLTTVRADGQPQPVPVWFWWDGSVFRVFSQPDARKLRNIRRNPRVSLNLNSSATGGEVVRAEGTAETVEDAPPPSEEYVEKYRGGISRIGLDVEDFSRLYSVAIRITPERWRTW